MKLRGYSLSCAVVAMLLAPAPGLAATKPPRVPGPPPLSPRFLQVRQHIKALFQNRNEAPPPPDPQTNPFRPAGAAAAITVASGTGLAPAPVVSSTDLMLLQQAVAGLRVTGTFERADQSYVVINARPYKKGDVVQTHVEGDAGYLRVREITRHTVTLTLNETEMTLKF